MNAKTQSYQMGRTAFWHGIKRWRKDERFRRALRMMHLIEQFRMTRQWKLGWRDAAEGM